MTLLLPGAELIPEIQDLLPKITLRSFESKEEFSELFRNKTKERYALLHSYKLWLSFGASDDPEVMFYRDMRERMSSFQPHLSSRR
ncbi:hypothetical protein R5R35_012386 [Gryllus longicercus]|uniref:Uncharacterized protein n=1 Tax=Gryllus longicercus TaxID=2509291 RepID=A0AAN9V4Y2_9ORTH